MSHAAKFLIVANLVFAVVLATMSMSSYAWRENYKRRWDQDTRDLKRELDAANLQLANLSLAKVRAEMNSQVRENRAQQVQSDLQVKIDELLLKDTEISNLKTDKKRSEDQLVAAQDNVQTLNESLRQARKRNSELVNIAQIARATAFNLNVKLAEVEDDLNNSQTELSARTTELAKIRQDLNQSKAMLASLQKLNPTLYRDLVDEKGSTKSLEGVVAAIVPAAEGLPTQVMLSIGTSSGVEEGNEFIIYRGSDYIAKVRAERVLNDMSSCRVLTEFPNQKNLAIQQGDVAVNKL